MRKLWLTAIATLLAFGASVGASRAQFTPPGEQADLTIDAATRGRVIDAICKALDTNYVFPETAKRMNEMLKTKAAEHAYDNVTSGQKFARLLTQHLQEISHDKHLRVRYSFETLPPERNEQHEPSAEEMDKMKQAMSARNFGFEKVERLEGNVGYIDLRNFMPAFWAGDTAAAAMNFLANTDALIIDLRKNGGGEPGMVALLCSYLFPEGGVVHLNDLYFRPTNDTHQWWTLPYLPGKRYAGKSVYVLTSKRTFSAAEECTYNLKCLKRATIVGETTGGGAHPGGEERLDDHFKVFLPSGRAINPVTKTNWEGTGVTPDIAVPADLALKAAHVAALDKVAERHAGDKETTARLKRLKEVMQKELDELKTKKASADTPAPAGGR